MHEDLFRNTASDIDVLNNLRQALDRPKQPEPDPEGEEATRRTREFLEGLKDETLPVIESPIKGLREALGITRQELAAVMYLSYSRACAIEAGGLDVVPGTLIKVVETILPGSGLSFQSAWTRFRNGMGTEAREAVERKLYPAGKCYGMAP